MLKTSQPWKITREFQDGWKPSAGDAMWNVSDILEDCEYVVCDFHTKKKLKKIKKWVFE